MGFRSQRVAAMLYLAFAATAVAMTLAHAEPPDPRRGNPRRPPHAAGPIAALARRMDRYFVEHAVDGVTLDSRFDINPPEAIRQSVVCQLLGYAELEALFPLPRFERTISRDADYLIEHLAEVRSHTPFDGMLGYSLLDAYAVSRDPRHLAAARAVTDEMLAIPTSACILNGGLMVALATARDAELFGTAGADTKTREILAQLGPYENADGSFPHWCYGSEDIHYTGWMGHELIHLERMTGDPAIPPMLARMNAFMEARIGGSGASVYESPCPGDPASACRYWSRATGCGFDYDTRGWTVEPGYQVLLFDHQRSPKLAGVLAFLLSLEHRGTFPDLYGYWPPPEDPEYPWTIADTSIANMSIIFWSLATALRDRRDVAEARLVWGEPATPPAPPGPVEPVPVDPEPPSGRDRPGLEPPLIVGQHEIRFTLEEPARVTLDVLDLQGRLVRALDAGEMGAGTRAVRWDQRDANGSLVRSGVYLASLQAGARRWTLRWIVFR